MTLRLVKITMQATLVEDDGTNLTEVPSAPFEVSAAELPDFAERFLAQLAERSG